MRHAEGGLKYMCWDRSIDRLLLCNALSLKPTSTIADSEQMTVERPYEHSRSAKATKAHVKGPQVEESQVHTMTEVDHAGEWISAEELKEAALNVLSEDKDITLNLGKVDHLNASVLQVLLALDMEHKKHGRQVHLENASPSLRQWFEYAGAAGQFNLGRQSVDE
jgi:anti-anti-sigma regulatory factor